VINTFLRNFLKFYFQVMNSLIASGNRRDRRKFRKRYAIFYAKNSILTFPLAGFDAQKERLQEVHDKMHGPKYFAKTSGTTKEPKLIPYDLKRTRHLQKTFLRSMVTLTARFPGQKTFFVFASLQKDSSLTAGMMEEGSKPSRLELLQAPYRYLHTKEGLALIERVGELTARIMVLAVTQPRFLYATNPSTLTFFLKELETRWKEVRVRLKNIPPGLQKLSDPQGDRLLMTFLIREKAPRLQELLPELKAIITWDGGYVKPFLDQLRNALPGITFLPMYSMSTETIETLPHVIDGKLHFLPVSKGVYPEFQEIGQAKVLAPFDLEAGKTYELIINDEWGLRRYLTGDLFYVKEIIGSLPDLAFVKRKGVTSSLTGEKLTEDQVNELKAVLDKKFPELTKLPVTLYPVSRNGEMGYELALIGKIILSVDFSDFADQELGKINSEYEAKVKSGRLLPLKVTHMTEQELAAAMGKSEHWESQFKILPLYEKPVAR
jgi:hypothetical protein